MLERVQIQAALDAKI